MRPAILIIAITLAGCSFTPRRKDYTATAVAVASDPVERVHVSMFGTSTVKATSVTFRTPRDVYFSVVFRNDAPSRFPGNVMGTVRYHECGQFLYCLDSFEAIH